MPIIDPDDNESVKIKQDRGFRSVNVKNDRRLKNCPSIIDDSSNNHRFRFTIFEFVKIILLINKL